MTGRDRLVAIGLATLAVLAAGWLLVVSPERKQAASLATQVSEARARLASVEGTAAAARSAQAQYAAAYASIVSLGKAVPPSREVPSLIYQLSQASKQKNVEFASITAGSNSGSSASAASGAIAGFTQMPFTFVFNGNFFDLQHLFEAVDDFAQRTDSGDLQVSGRLLTIQSVTLTHATSATTAGSSGASSEALTGSIAATAYVLPGPQGLTNGASATSPVDAATTPSTNAAASSPTPPAIARVNP
jgi:Tfp pilus assembly protein PilO